MITFRAEDHSYWRDGVQIPSVTQILERAGLGVDYRGIDPAILARARDRGIYVDACCDLADAGELDETKVHEECRGYVQAWQAYRAESGLTVIATQALVYHPELGYAGTPDVYAMFGPCPVLLDRKCTSKISPTYALQLAGYAMPGIRLVVDGDGEGVPLAKCMRVVVQLKPDGRFVSMHCDAQAKAQGRDDYAAFQAAITLARWRSAS